MLSLEEVRAEKAVRNLRDYTKQAWPILEPSTEYLHNWHIDVLCEYLEAVTAGEITRLLINMPPRYMKSICVTVCWPTWEWLRKPSTRWLFTSYAESLAIKHSLDRRRIIESYWYQQRWGNRYQIASDQNEKKEYENTERGVMASFGLDGAVTGKGGNRIVVDDPHNPKKAASDAEREGAKRIFRETLYTRLDDKKKGAIVVTAQRLHYSDLSQECIDMGYTHLNLPAEAEGRTTISVPSGKEFVREDMSLLWPEREGPEEIAAAKVALGSYGYGGQYQQRPSPAEGGKLKRYWFRFWHYADKPLPPVLVRMSDGTLYECPVAPLPASFDDMAQSWDMSFKDTKASDFVAGGVFGQLGANIFLVDWVHDRMDMPATLVALESLTTRHPRALTKLIEDKANGPAVISTLRSKITGLIAVEPEGGKASRVAAVSPVLEAGNFYLPHPLIRPDVQKIIEEAAGFPNAAHDDLVDMITQALIRMAFSSQGIF